MSHINKKLNYLNRKLVTIKYYYMVEKSKIDKQNLIARAVLKLHYKKDERRLVYSSALLFRGRLDNRGCAIHRF